MRLVTRGDLDGLTCAVLITSCEDIDEILLVHPQDITDKRLHITEDDIIANLPYQAGVREVVRPSPAHREQRAAARKGSTGATASPPARRAWSTSTTSGRSPTCSATSGSWPRRTAWTPPSSPWTTCCRPEGLHPPRLHPRPAHRPRRLPGLLPEARGLAQDGGASTRSWRQPEVQRARGADPRPGRGLPRAHARPARASTATSSSPTSATRARCRWATASSSTRCSRQANVSLRVHWGPSREHVAAAVGHSIFNRTSGTNVGELMSRYGGGGHRGAGHLPAAGGRRPRRRSREIIDDHEEGRLRLR